MVLNSYYFLETGPQNLKLNLLPCPKYKDLPLLSSLFFFMPKWLAILLYLYLYVGFYFYFLKISLKKALLEPFIQQGTVLYQGASFSLEVITSRLLLPGNSSPFLLVSVEKSPSGVPTEGLL